MKRFTSILTATLLVWGLLLSVPINSEAGSSRAKGTIRAVDLNRGLVTLSKRGGESVTVNAVERTEITRNGQAARLHDLLPGDKATIKYDSQSLNAAKIDARGPEREPTVRVDGTFSGVDAESSTVVIDPLPEGDPVRLTIGSSTTLSLDGRAATLAEMASGFGVVAVRHESSTEAMSVSAESLAEVRGVIQEVNTEARTVTIDPLEGDSNVTLNVVEGTAISLNRRPASLSDLARGFHVRASFDPATHNARRIDSASLLEILGQIRAVNLESAKVTIAPLGDAPAVELQVVHSTVITINGEPAALDRLQPGMPAHAVYNLASLVADRIDARAEGGSDCTVAGISGEIKNVNVEAKTLTTDPQEGEEVTLNITERTEITLNGRPARLTELLPRMRVGARFCRETKNALAVAAFDHEDECTVVGVEGAVARVDVEGHKLAVTTASGEEVVLDVTPRTEIKLNGEPARLGDLQPGMRVSARLCRETLTALFITATSGGGDCTAESISGEIKSVNLEAKTLTIEVPGGGPEATLNVTERTEIALNGRPARLSDLQPGMRASARFCRETLNALAVVATSGDECEVAGVQGEISAVDLDQRVVAITPPGGEPVRLNVTERTEITIDGRPARLNDLQVGMRAGARFCRQTHNALGIAALSSGEDCTVVSVEGAVARVDVEGHHLVIALASGEQVTLNVTDRTEIKLNNEAARLSDLRERMRVAARFCRETSNALVISAFTAAPDCTVARVEGAIAEIDLEGHTITVATASGERVTLNVTDRTEIKINGQAARLSDLRTGWRAEARFCRETSNALTIQATRP